VTGIVDTIRFEPLGEGVRTIAFAWRRVGRGRVWIRGSRKCSAYCRGSAVK